MALWHRSTCMCIRAGVPGVAGHLPEQRTRSSKDHLCPHPDSAVSPELPLQAWGVGILPARGAPIQPRGPAQVSPLV